MRVVSVPAIRLSGHDKRILVRNSCVDQIIRKRQSAEELISGGAYDGISKAIGRRCAHGAVCISPIRIRRPATGINATELITCQL